MLVSEVVADSPAERAGLAVGDILTQLDDEPITGSRALARSVRALSADQEVGLEVWRDGSPLAFSVRAAERERPLVLVDRLPAIGDDLRFQVELLEGGDRDVEVQKEELVEGLGRVVGDGRWLARGRRLEGIDWQEVTRRMEELERQLRALEERMREVEPRR